MQKSMQHSLQLETIEHKEIGDESYK